MRPTGWISSPPNENPSCTAFAVINMALLRDFVNGAEHVDDTAHVQFISLGGQSWDSATAIKSENL